MKTEPRDGTAADMIHTPPSPTRRSTAKRPSAWVLLRRRDYALLFWGQLISAAGTQVATVVIAWQVFLLTHSAVALGLLGLMQAIPRLLFSLVGGIYADALDRRRLLLAVNAVLAAISAILALTTTTSVISIGIIYGAVLCSAVASAFEFPARPAIIPTLVPREQMADALSLSMVMMQLTFIVGATAGGLILANFGIANSYWIDVASYVVVIGALLLMRVPRVPLERRAQAGCGALAD